MKAQSPLNDPTQWIPADAYRAYLGPDSDKLMGHYQKAVAKKKLMSASFNLFAFLALPIWFAYRRQWVAFAVLLAAAIGVIVYEHFSGSNTRALSGALLGLSFFANSFLLATATEQYKRLIRSGATQTQVIERLQNKAARSTKAAIASVIVFFGVLFATAFALELMWPSMPS